MFHIVGPTPLLADSGSSLPMTKAKNKILYSMRCPMYVFIIRSVGNDENVSRHGSDGNTVPNACRSGFHVQ